ncbi:hypothetical protein HIM_04863 [Hirsutella minnesotensis 3608]|uniref:CENP-T/Histone H4 histone fold domain-containing protein n=1 Tax=Hirsutella minnesotensis 3608 TaxID=1043627 RepID=A0A0F7ZKW6_9HYPO|nr:hypothetical protein HIM_04863 [Hirsutella minnesotensis 3608]
MDSTPLNSSSAGHERATSGFGPANATVTPSRRALSAEPLSSRPSLHTPLNRDAPRDLLASIRHRTPASGARRNINNAPTPHAKAARLALHQRRTALFTPGKNRRRSLMEQRETPMDILRNLSRALAPKSKPVVSSSPSEEQPSMGSILEQDEDDDELPIDRPRLSLPLNEDDSDDDLQPPRSSILEDENFTVQSVELPRRAVSEQPKLGLARGSLGDGRLSDFFDQTHNDLTLDPGRQSDFFPGLLEDLQARTAADDFTFDRIEVDPVRRQTLGRDSDFGLELPAGLDDQTTFMLSEPSEGPDAGTPAVEHSNAEAAGDQSRDLQPDISLAQDYPELAEWADDSDDGIMEDATVEPPNLVSDGRKRQKRISKHGVQYPPLPPSFVKKVAQTALQSSGLSNPRISADTLTALTQASEWFFEQLGDDLGAYAQHAKRKTVEESDVVTLMGRQRQVGSEATLFSLAQRHLPRELLQELRMPVPQANKKRRGKRPHGDDE